MKRQSRLSGFYSLTRRAALLGLTLLVILGGIPWWVADASEQGPSQGEDPGHASSLSPAAQARGEPAGAGPRIACLALDDDDDDDEDKDEKTPGRSKVDTRPTRAPRPTSAPKPTKEPEQPVQPTITSMPPTPTLQPADTPRPPTLTPVPPSLPPAPPSSRQGDKPPPTPEPTETAVAMRDPCEDGILLALWIGGDVDPFVAGAQVLPYLDPDGQVEVWAIVQGQFLSSVTVSLNRDDRQLAQVALTASPEKAMGESALREAVALGTISQPEALLQALALGSAQAYRGAIPLAPMAAAGTYQVLAETAGQPACPGRQASVSVASLAMTGMLANRSRLPLPAGDPPVLSVPSVSIVWNIGNVSLTLSWSPETLPEVPSVGITGLAVRSRGTETVLSSAGEGQVPSRRIAPGESAQLHVQMDSAVSPDGAHPGELVLCAEHDDPVGARSLIADAALPGP
ncbi:MAG: hypothetical protein ACYC5M_02480 [Anaerolineae bacterium]